MNGRQHGHSCLFGQESIFVCGKCYNKPSFWTPINIVIFVLFYYFLIIRNVTHTWRAEVLSQASPGSAWPCSLGANSSTLPRLLTWLGPETCEKIESGHKQFISSLTEKRSLSIMRASDHTSQETAPLFILPRCPRPYCPGPHWCLMPYCQ